MNQEKIQKILEKHNILNYDLLNDLIEFSNELTKDVYRRSVMKTFKRAKELNDNCNFQKTLESFKNNND